MLEQGREAPLIDSLEPLSLRTEQGVLAAGGRCNRLERRLIKT